MSGYKHLAEKVGFLWSFATTVVSPTALTWLLAGLFVSQTLRYFAIGATVVAALFGFLLAAAGVEEWSGQRRRRLAATSLAVFVVAALICSFVLTALRPDVASMFPVLRETGRFLTLATPFSNVLIAAVWGLSIGSLVFSLVALSPNLPNV